MFTLYFPNKNSFFLSQLQPQALNSLAYTTLCKWGALILTLLTTLFIIRFRHISARSIPLIIADYDFSDNDSDDEEEISSEIEEEDDEDEEEEEEEEDRTNDEYFSFKGSTNDNGAFLRHRSIGDLLSLSEIANTKTVVKLWDSIGFELGLGFDHFYSSSDGGLTSVYGDNETYGGASPAVVVSAGENTSGNLAVGVWDTRLRRRIPAVLAEWGPSIGNAVRVESDDMHKVYVKDDGRYGLTVGDMRNARSPLENVMESQIDLWCKISFSMKI